MDLNCEGLNHIFECEGPSVITLTKQELTPVYDARVSFDRGSVWINNGTDHRMVFEDAIPDGWVKGRLNVHENKEQFRQQGLNNNSNAKHYRIVFIDGSEVECYQLSKWARENNISYGICKSILRQTRYNKRKYIKKNASTNIKSIHEVTTELLTSN